VTAQPTCLVRPPAAGKAYAHRVDRRVSLVIGVVLVLVGIIWTLQGLDILGGSGMSGVGIWAVIGPFVALIGIVVALGARRKG
jgi:hypothetical protein